MQPEPCVFVLVPVKVSAPLGENLSCLSPLWVGTCLAKRHKWGTRKMYGILAGCIAIMAVFLGLFAISVEPSAQDQLAFTADQTAQVQTVADRPGNGRQ